MTSYLQKKLKRSTQILTNNDVVIILEHTTLSEFHTRRVQFHFSGHYLRYPFSIQLRCPASQPSIVLLVERFSEHFRKQKTRYSSTTPEILRIVGFFLSQLLLKSGYGRLFRSQPFDIVEIYYRTPRTSNHGIPVHRPHPWRTSTE